MSRTKKLKEYDSGPKYLGVVTHKEVEKMVGTCVNHLKKKKYELSINPINRWGEPTTRTDGVSVVKLIRPSKYAQKCLKMWAKGERGYGGARKIYIGLNYYQFRTGPATYTEYRSFNLDPVIGQIWTTSNYQRLWLVVAHEVAHHVQHLYAPKVHRYRESGTRSWRKPHGDCFKDIYRYLRADLINPMILRENESSAD